MRIRLATVKMDVFYLDGERGGQNEFVEKG
jgi:hypothetical protein